MTAMISLVVARAANGVIGNKGAIPWRLPEDMRHFKAITMGKPCVMGRKTWDSLPKKPLPGRTNIVVTRDRTFHADGAVVVHAFEEALKRAEAESPEEIAVVGGAEIYRAALPCAARIHLTEVHADVEGDVHMPVFDSVAWHEVSREDHPAIGGSPGFSFVTLDRR
jgi:dihydrofolate reductase